MATRRRNAKSAGRPIQYDRATAIEAATRLFFEKGFRDTSVQDVVAATGMQTGSVYAAFGSKLELFLECLDVDLSELRQQVDELEAAEGPALDALLAFWQIDGGEPASPSFAARALVDFTDRESEVWQRIQAAWSTRDDTIHRVIRLAQASGGIRSDLDAVTIERHINSLILGSRFMSHYICDAQCPLSRQAVIEFLAPRAIM